MKTTAKFLFTAVLSGAPVVVLAADPQYIQGLSGGFVDTINFYLAPGLLALAFIVFLWGVYKQFIWKGDSGEAHTEGAKFVATGLIGFVIILSLWALVNIFISTFGLGGSSTPSVPYSPPNTTAPDSDL